MERLVWRGEGEMNDFDKWKYKKMLEFKPRAARAVAETIFLLLAGVVLGYLSAIIQFMLNI
ncbi:MAG: hypothetical protein EHM49_01790 [Deltaproteobacteria bacterium]|nr:MAG: hypothetical protein EHM49_01790 [Deltaproteobacteria bacterium]